MSKSKTNFRQMSSAGGSGTKLSAGGVGKQVKHPLAKYNKLGQLVCVICETNIKNEIVWNAHLLSKKHKDSVWALKSGESNKTDLKKVKTEPGSFKTPLLAAGTKKPSSGDYFVAPLGKKIKTEPAYGSSSGGAGLPSCFFDSSKPTGGGEKKPKSILKNSMRTTPSSIISPNQSSLSNKSSSSQLPAAVKQEPGTSDESSADDKKSLAESSGLPADFFDSPAAAIKATTKGASTSDASTADPSTSVPPTPGLNGEELPGVVEKLPEGFFDDPKKDAKARKVDYVDPKEKEWEEFQSMVRKETKIAEDLQEADDEHSEMTKDLTELENMKECLTRVQRVKKLVIETKEREKIKTEVKKEEDSDSDDEVELDLFDWRAKKV